MPCHRGVVHPAWPLALRALPVRDVVTAGTVFQDSHLPLTVWFRAIWQITSQKNGISALGLQCVLGLGSYKTVWAMLQKLSRAIVRPGRDRLLDVVEVDETYWGAEEASLTGRQTVNKTIITVAVEEDGRKIGRVSLQTITRPVTVVFSSGCASTVVGHRKTLIFGHLPFGAGRDRLISSAPQA